MKFDLIISNPPYNHGLDLKILKQVYPLGEKICLIHPATWLYDNKKKNKLFKSTRELIKDHFVGYEKVENANELFGIGLFTDVLITEIDKSKSGIGDKIYDIDVHGDSPIYRRLKKKILDYCQNIGNLMNKVKYTGVGNKITKDLEWEVGFSGIGCNMGRKDFLSIIRLDETKHIGRECLYRKKNQANIFEFETENEAVNFKDYLKLKLTRFCLSIYKITQTLNAGGGSGEIASVPYMPTYEKQWTDEEVAAELGLTDEELRWAINWVPDYYPEDAEKYEKFKEKLRVTFPNGKHFEDNNTTKVFVEVLSEIGLSKVEKLGIKRMKRPLVSNFIKEEDKKFHHTFLEEYVVFHHSSNAVKIKILEEISEKLNLGLKIRL